MGALKDLKLSDLTVNFVGMRECHRYGGFSFPCEGLMAENGRTTELGSIVAGFEKLMDSHRGVVNATVIHAVRSCHFLGNVVLFSDDLE